MPLLNVSPFRESSSNTILCYQFVPNSTGLISIMMICCVMWDWCLWSSTQSTVTTDYLNCDHILSTESKINSLLLLAMFSNLSAKKIIYIQYMFTSRNRWQSKENRSKTISRLPDIERSQNQTRTQWNTRYSWLEADKLQF